MYIPLSNDMRFPHCTECGESVGAVGLCESCASYEEEAWERYDEEPDYGGAFDGIGTVYSDADPGL